MIEKRNCNFKRFENELFIDWICTTLFKTKGFIERLLERHFGSKKKWNFKTGSTKYYTSQVVNRINSCFLWNKHFINLYNFFYQYINNMLAAITLQILCMFMFLINLHFLVGLQNWPEKDINHQILIRGFPFHI